MKKYGFSQTQNSNFQPYTRISRERTNDSLICPEAAQQARKQAYERQRKTVTQLDFKLLWGLKLSVKD
jgi:hypothetical protein